MKVALHQPSHIDCLASASFINLIPTTWGKQTAIEARVWQSTGFSFFPVGIEKLGSFFFLNILKMEPEAAH